MDVVREESAMAVIRSRRAKGTLLAFVLLAGALTALPAQADARPRTADEVVDEWRLFDLANEARVQNGRAKLAMAVVLRDQARSWSDHMAATGQLAHSPNVRNDANYASSCWSMAGENVGMGSSASSVHNLLMASNDHRANLLGDYDYVGMGVAWVGGRMWVTQRFLKLQPGCPALAVASRPATREIVAFRTDNTAWMMRFDMSGEWIGRRQLSGGTGWSYRSLAGPANLDVRDASLEAVALAPDGTAWVHDFDATGRWLGRRQLSGGNGWSYPVLSGAANLDQRDRNTESVAIATDGTAWMHRFDAWSNWLGRIQLGGAAGWGSYRVLSGPANLDTSDPGLEIVALRNDGTAWLLKFTTAGEWAGRRQLAGGTGWSYTSVSGLGNIDTRNSTLEAVGIQGDGTAWLLQFNAAGEWTGRRQLAGGAGWSYRSLSTPADLDTTS
jgi:uncharacterized protein YkwD